MRRFLMLFTTVCVVLSGWNNTAPAQTEVRRLPVSEYVDKMKAGWIGQMAGVGWGGPTEFKWKGEIIPADKIPVWKPSMINQFRQDDIYVEMTFLRTLEVHGWDVPIEQAGLDFAASGYPLWHANRGGRDNLRNGIAPPDSGHPQFNDHADDIDYQIEADYSGLVAPGLPNMVIELGEKFGRLMNYGDGLYGGQFVGGMYAEAFFEDDPVMIVEAGLKCIPAESQYAECIRDTLTWYKENPDDWEKTWTLINDKYHLNPEYRKFSCSGPDGAFNIDAKINGAYIVMGLLYGQGDLDQTIVISTRCGQDSDCNPSNAGGVLFTTVGFSKLPDRFTSELDPNGKFSHTPYNFPMLIDVCKKLVRSAVERNGGRIEKDAAGEEVFVIPVVAPKPSKLEQCWEPGPVANSRYDAEQLKEIREIQRREQEEREKKITANLAEDMEKFAPGWTVQKCNAQEDPGLKPEFRGKENVLVTHPMSQATPCTLTREVDLPAGRKATLRLVVGHHTQGDWQLIVRANQKGLLSEVIGKDTAENGWKEVSVDLSPLAGRTVALELVNKANGWMCEWGYWSKIEISD
jgi:hypothetical protein